MSHPLQTPLPSPRRNWTPSQSSSEIASRRLFESASTMARRSKHRKNSPTSSRQTKHFGQTNKNIVAAQAELSNLTMTCSENVAQTLLQELRTSIALAKKKIMTEKMELATLGSTDSENLAQPLSAEKLRTSVNFAKIRSELANAFPELAQLSRKPGCNFEEFHCFTRLPIELQLQIWHHAIDDIPDRVIMLQPNTISTPGLVQACATSRSESQKRFQFTMSSPNGNRPKVYSAVDFNTDIVHLGTNHTIDGGYGPLFGFFEERSLHYAARSYKDCWERVVHMALDIGDATACSDGYGIWSVLPEICPAVRRLILVITRPSKAGKVRSREGGQEYWGLKRIELEDIDGWTTDLLERHMARRHSELYQRDTAKGALKGVQLEFMEMEEMEE